MTDFNSIRTYDPRYEVRDYHRLVHRIRENWPQGVFWALVAARRRGKTWSLKAVQHALGHDAARFIDLRHKGADFDGEPRAGCLLLDEPGVRLGEPAASKSFLARIQYLRDRNAKVLVAMSPAEWDLIADAGRPLGLIDEKDLLYLDVLPWHADRIVARTAWSSRLFQEMTPADRLAWQQTPFLLELLFETAEPLANLRENARAAMDAAVRASAHTKYRESTFDEGLNEAQRDAVRSVARSVGADTPRCEFLHRCGLLDRRDRSYALTDPILVNHLPPPLRIHHVSDTHVGDKAAVVGDVKARDDSGRILAAGVGTGPVRDEYLAHVEALGARNQAPHLVVVSGDIAERGDPALYAELEGWFARLQRALAPHPHLDDGSPRILLVGGNHDVDWGQALGEEGARRRHRPFFDAYPAYPRPALPTPPRERDLAQVIYPDLGVEVLLLGSAEFGGEIETDAERKKVLTLLNDLRKKIEAAEKARDEDKLRTLLKRVARIDPGLVHEEELERARRHPWLHAVRIAVLHHPVSPMPSPTREVAPFAGLINAGQVKDMLFAKGFCLVLHGHVHMGWFASEQWPGQHADWTLRIAAAPTLGSRETYEQHGFNEVEVVREGSVSTVTVRAYRRKGDTWELQNQMGPFQPGSANPTPDAVPRRR